MFGLRWLRRHRRRPARQEVAPGQPTPPREPVCYAVQTSRLLPDGTTLVIVSCHAVLPWTLRPSGDGESVYAVHRIPLTLWSGLSEAERRWHHGAVHTDVLRAYQAAWNNDQKHSE